MYLTTLKPSFIHEHRLERDHASPQGHDPARKCNPRKADYTWKMLRSFDKNGNKLVAKILLQYFNLPSSFGVCSTKESIWGRTHFKDSPDDGCCRPRRWTRVMRRASWERMGVGKSITLCAAVVVVAVRSIFHSHSYVFIGKRWRRKIIMFKALFVLLRLMLLLPSSWRIIFQFTSAWLPTLWKSLKGCFGKNFSARKRIKVEWMFVGFQWAKKPFSVFRGKINWFPVNNFARQTQLLSETNAVDSNMTRAFEIEKKLLCSLRRYHLKWNFEVRAGSLGTMEFVVESYHFG